MDFTNLIKSRRSIRDFEDKSVALDTVKEIISESCLAPSSGNRQEWRFVIVMDKGMIKRISDESKNSHLDDAASDPYIQKYIDTLRDDKFNVFYNAPCLILVCGPKNNHSLLVDCSLVAVYLMLCATERGLGTCWIGLGSRIRDKDLRKEIGIEEEVEVVAPIILGYPRQIPAVPERKPPQILRVIT
jgi:nitroreductase